MGIPHRHPKFSPEAFRLLRANQLAKGDALAVARLAGIQAGKRTADWIPLCHTVPLTHLDVDIALSGAGRKAVITATAQARWTTGVEMEALVAASAAALALFVLRPGRPEPLDAHAGLESFHLQAGVLEVIQAATQSAIAGPRDLLRALNMSFLEEEGAWWTRYRVELEGEPASAA